ncbi:Scr1 family TA system antitoxin-like transcriptional regulator [Kitasatospora sp. McL0602]|uniref:Scr1 family TA system antitoxin-like transcriptional regulator n=1 Tax=Kitasatospora sp. McL0602 TaxID=3439530 RepID=UPI003F8BDEEB
MRTSSARDVGNHPGAPERRPGRRVLDHAGTRAVRLRHPPLRGRGRVQGRAGADPFGAVVAGDTPDVRREPPEVEPLPDDSQAGAAERTSRARYFGQDGRTYHVLLGEQALLTGISGGPELMRAQLDPVGDLGVPRVEQRDQWADS